MSTLSGTPAYVFTATAASTDVTFLLNDGTGTKTATLDNVALCQRPERYDRFIPLPTPATANLAFTNGKMTVSANAAGEGVKTVIQTVPGEVYRLSFDYAKLAPGVTGTSVTANGVTLGNVNTDGTVNINFTAAATQTTLSFVPQGSGYRSVSIDNFKVTYDAQYSLASGGYAYGFGGQFKDDEIYGEGNSYTAEYWQYDPRLGRRWNVDPMTSSFPWQSPYVAFDDNPIVMSDPKGLAAEDETDPPGGGDGKTSATKASSTPASAAMGAAASKRVGASHNGTISATKSNTYQSSKKEDLIARMPGDEAGVAFASMGYEMFEGLYVWGTGAVGEPKHPDGHYITRGSKEWERYTLSGLLTIGIIATEGMTGYMASASTGSTTFYTIQSESDAARLLNGGTPWPTSPSRAHLGPGIYSWGSEAEASAYLQKITSMDVNANVKIVQFEISNSNLSKLNSFVVPTEDGAANTWLGQHSSLFGAGKSHGYQYIQRSAGMGVEHYFSSDVINLLKLR